MNIEIRKTYGKNPSIGWWAIFAIFPTITITRCSDFIKDVPVYEITIGWLLWYIKINNNKSY